MPLVEDAATTPPANVVKLLGPGLLVAAAGIGASDIVSATLAGASHGLALLWVIALAAFLKCFLNEGIARFRSARRLPAPAVWASRT